MPELSIGWIIAVSGLCLDRQQLQFRPDRPLELVQQRVGCLLVGHVGTDPLLINFRWHSSRSPSRFSPSVVTVNVRIVACLVHRGCWRPVISLFWLTFVAAMLLWSWRIGWWKVVAAVAVLPALLFGVAWIWLLFDKARR